MAWIYAIFITLMKRGFILEKEELSVCFLAEKAKLYSLLAISMEKNHGRRMYCY